ncbi:MAG TPA: hypothetical protein VKW04_13705, partial [Planctomycetota bacterium]|nr:hypothetical protein [Planctomycetota bacterium]
MAIRVRTRRWGLGVVLALSAAAGCRTGELVTREKPVHVETVFVEQDHKIQACMKDLAASYLDLQDSVLFVDRDSTLRIKPPSMAGSEPYHAHLGQRVGGHLLDQVFHQNAEGRIEIDLSHYADPETLIITSAACEILQQEVPSYVKKAHPGAQPEKGIAPPYVVSYKLLPAETASTIIPLQSFRYDIETPVGVLHLLPTSFNRMDQILTLVDPSRKLSDLMDEDPYVTIAKYNTAIVPRLTVEVLGTGGQVWERTGTWHTPSGLDRLFKPGEKPFVIRSDERELISFAQPPRVDLVLPEGVPATSARIGATFSGVGEKDSLKFVLGCVYPSGRKGDFGARVQTHDISKDTKTAIYTADLDHLPPEAFPLTSSITHRLVQPYRLTGGRFAPQEPQGKVVLASIAKTNRPKGPENVVFARYASHYDFLLFFGGGPGAPPTSLANSYRNGTDNTPSTNLTPPPPGGGNGLPPILITPPPSEGGGSSAGGGPDSNCGCGNKGENCPADQPCKGHCAPCRCQGNNNNSGSIVVPLTCVMKGTGCQPDNECQCGPHTWSESDCMSFIGNMTKGAAETAWFGGQFGLAPCHAVTPVAMLRVTFWGAGLQKIYQWYVVSVTFGPCAPVGQPPLSKFQGQFIPKTSLKGAGNGGGTNLVDPPPTGGSPNT